MARAREMLRPAERLIGAVAGYSLAATIVAGVLFFLCLLVFVFVHGNERLTSPLLLRAAPPGDLEALAEAVVRPAGVALVLLTAVSAIVGYVDRRRPDR